MKTIFAVAGLAIALAGVTYGGPEVIIKQRAKELANENNVRQGVAPPTTAPAPASSAATPTPTLAPALGRFPTDLTAISANSQVTAAQKQKLTQELLAGALQAKPSPAAAAKLVDDLAAAFAEKPLSPSSRARLLMELDAVLNPAKYPQAKMEGIFADIQAIFQENGLSRNKAVTISNDVKSVSAEIQHGGAK